MRPSFPFECCQAFREAEKYSEALPVEKSYKKMRLIFPENVCSKGPEMRVVLENQKAKRTKERWRAALARCIGIPLEDFKELFKGLLNKATWQC